MFSLERRFPPALLISFYERDEFGLEIVGALMVARSVDYENYDNFHSVFWYVCILRSINTKIGRFKSEYGPEKL